MVKDRRCGPCVKLSRHHVCGIAGLLEPGARACVYLEFLEAAEDVYVLGSALDQQQVAAFEDLLPSRHHVELAVPEDRDDAMTIAAMDSDL